MQFISQLSIEEFYERLERNTCPLNISNYINRKRILSRVNGNRVLLIKLGAFGVFSSQNPFIGKVLKKEGILMLKGAFMPTIPMRIACGIVTGIGWLGGLLSCINSFSWDVFFLVIVGLSVWTFLGILLITKIANLFCKKQQKEVIDFINKNLLH